MMEKIVAFWQTDTNGKIWRMLNQYKEIIIEPRASAEFLTCINKFNVAVDGNKGAVLFGVCRGKLSEGIDFSDAKGRAVVITGLPYAPRNDPKVLLKRQYLDDLRKDLIAKHALVKKSSSSSTPSFDPQKMTLSGTTWYTQQAYRAVNQALGRVIRHKRDYGAILLLDERFSRDRDSLSAWIRPYFTVSENIGSILSGLSSFFRTAAIRYAPNVILSLDSDKHESRSSTPDPFSVGKDNPGNTDKDNTNINVSSVIIPRKAEAVDLTRKEDHDLFTSFTILPKANNNASNNLFSSITNNNKIASQVSKANGNDSTTPLSLASALSGTTTKSESSMRSNINTSTFYNSSNIKGSVLSNANPGTSYFSKSSTSNQPTTVIVENTVTPTISQSTNRLQGLITTNNNATEKEIIHRSSDTNTTNLSTSSSGPVLTISSSSSKSTTNAVPSSKAKDYLTQLKSFLQEQDYTVFRSELQTFSVSHKNGISRSSINKIVQILLSLIQKHVKPETLYKGEELLTNFIDFIPEAAKESVRSELEQAKEKLFTYVRTAFTMKHKIENDESDRKKGKYDGIE